MADNQIENRVYFVLPRDQKDRVTIDLNEFGELDITIDLHGLLCKDVDKLVSNIIAILQVPFTLELIHGFNHGTALKEHIYRMKHPRIQDRYCEPWNPGLTIMKVA